MYCPNCGAQNDENYNNCTSCGKYIADINKEINRKNESYGSSVSFDNDTIKTDTKQLYVKPVTITEKVDEYTPDNSYLRQNERKYGDSIYRQNIKKPKDYFIFSILCAILGSLPFGIAAIITSAITKAESLSGNITKAGIYSEKTKVFCIISAIIGVLKYIFIIGIIIYNYYSISRYYGPYMW